MEHLALHDSLSELPTKHLFEDVTTQAILGARRTQSSVVVMLLDLDGFKSINDRHGHLCGSRALVEVGAVIRATVREIDVVARFGGDEFTVILPQTGRAGARVIADRIRERIAATHYLKAHGLEVRVTASLGIATYPEHGVTGDALVARADQAMYSAKGAGKDQVAVADARQPARQVA
jgi:diguanylate cyclase (GGDEF)-like protein